MVRIVIDTNVLVAALRSRLGASFKLLSQVGTGLFRIVLTVPLLMEYEDVLLRPAMVPVSAAGVQDIIDFICADATAHDVHFLWRPRLPDPKDDMVLEAAVNGGAAVIVTHNIRDFGPALSMGVQVMRPAEFLRFLEAQP
jgi:putative PIN family toxin of toxin-antitoxin system